MANKAFTTIAYNVTKMTSIENVRVLFDVLAGKRDLNAALALCTKSPTLESYAKSACHNPESWKACSHWAEWWLRDRHLRTLSTPICDIVCSIMSYCYSTLQKCSALLHLLPLCLTRYPIQPMRLNHTTAALKDQHQTS